MEAEYQQQKQRAPWLKKYEWKPGQSGNPNGRPPGKSLKTYVREYFESLPDEEKMNFLNQVSPELAWQMAEGRPPQQINADIKGDIYINLDPDLADKNDLNPSTKDDSERPA